MNRSYFALLIIFLISCNQRNEPKEVAQKQIVINAPQKDKTPDKPSWTKNFSYKRIAKYAMGSIMGQPPAIINVTKKNDMYYVSYVRESDSQKFDYKIKFEGNKIIWANSDGRWRIHPLDEKISFVEDDTQIKIIQTYSDGSQSVDEFDKE